MKHIIRLFICLALFLGGCRGQLHINLPVLPDTPEPDPLTGTFVSDHGTFTFNGDRKSIVVDIDEAFSEATGIPTGEQEGEYMFFQDLPPHGHVDVRYDAGYGMDIFLNEERYTLNLGYVNEDGKTAVAYLGIVEADKIPIYLSIDTLTTVLFEKK